MKRNLQLLCIIALMLFSGLANAQRKDSVIFHETFEDMNTRSLWTILNDGTCTSADWNYYTWTDQAALGSDIMAGYQSSKYAVGCASHLISPVIDIRNTNTNDSIMLSFFIFRSAINSNDAVNLTFVSENIDILEGPVGIRQYNQSPPATGTGWNELIWKIPYSSLSTLSTDKIRIVFTAISGGAADILIDEVKIHHRYQETQKELEILYPNGFETFNTNENVTISWNSSNVASVHLDYTLNGGGNWVNIAQNINATTASTYQWLTPNTASSNVKVRIREAAIGGLIDASDDFFTIRQPVGLMVKTPNGGETFTAGQVVNITWDAPNVNSGNIEYSLDNGGSWTSIVTWHDFGASTSYAWTVPSVQTTQGRIRIINSDNPNVSDQSDGTFTILNPKTLKLTSPNGGESYMYGTSQTITWTSNNINNVNIQLSVDGGFNWVNIASNIMAQENGYNWTVPKSLTLTAKVRVVNAEDANLNDESDAYFAITQNTSVGEEIKNTLFTLYPNPATGMVMLDFGKAIYNRANIIITDMAGKTVYTNQVINGTKQFNITLPALEQGIYNVTLLSNETSFSQKLFVK